MRRQSEAATALWIITLLIQSGVALRLPPHSKKVEIVFKDGVGDDSEKLIQSVQGLVGIR